MFESWRRKKPKIDVEEVEDWRNKQMRKASSNFSSDDVLTNFFYELLRDHLTAGQLEIIVRHCLDEKYNGPVVVFDNGWLAQYAANVAKRLKHGVEA